MVFLGNQSINQSTTIYSTFINVHYLKQLPNKNKNIVYTIFTKQILN